MTSAATRTWFIVVVCSFAFSIGVAVFTRYEVDDFVVAVVHCVRDSVHFFGVQVYSLAT